MKTLKISLIAILTLGLTITVVISCKKKKPETCTDGIHNQGEKAIDCGGPCKACPTCVDGIQNQDEIAVDCGGPCPACGNCIDGIKNQGEVGIDCGGPCPACITCTDGIKNGDEVGVDCGGSNCPACAIIYPPSGTHGINLLYGTDTLYTPGTGNSLKVTVPVGSTIKLEFSLISGQPWGWSSNNGWTVSAYANNMQTFEVLNPGTHDLSIIKFPGSGTSSFLIKYFENGTTETRRKVVIFT